MHGAAPKAQAATHSFRALRSSAELVASRSVDGNDAEPRVELRSPAPARREGAVSPPSPWESDAVLMMALTHCNVDEMEDPSDEEIDRLLLTPILFFT